MILSFWLCITRHAQSTQNKFACLYSISRKAWVMKLIFYLQINTKIFYELIVSFWVCMTRHAQSTQNNNFIISLQYLKENVMDGVDFSQLIIVKCFLKVILSFLMCVARHAKTTQNKKFAISLQFLKKEVNEEVDFLNAGKHKKLMILMILMEMVKHFQRSKNSKFTISVQYLKKEIRDEVDILHADKHQSDLQVDFNTLGTKFGYKVILWLLISMMKHSQITQSNNFANLCNISKKLGMEFIFCMQINTKVSKNWHYCFLWEQKIRKLVIFLQYIKKKVFCIFITAFVFYCDVRHLGILWGSSHVCCYLLFGYMVKNGNCLLHHDSKISYICFLSHRKHFRTWFSQMLLINIWLTVERLFPA